MPDGPADPGWALWLEAWTLAAHDHGVRELVAELEARWVGLLGEVVRSGVAARAFRCRAVDKAVTHLYATVNGLAVQVVTGTGGMTFDTRSRCACAPQGPNWGSQELADLMSETRRPFIDPPEARSGREPARGGIISRDGS